MSKVAIIADRSVLPALALSGVKVFDAGTSGKFSEVMTHIASDGDYKVVFVTEEAAELNPEEMEKASSGLNIVVIPGHGKKTGVFSATLEGLTMKATGAG